MYTLYTIPGSCSTGIAVLMEKLGVKYTSVKREDVENYTEIVPTNQVPALKTEAGQVIAEGGAIALYLLEKYEPSHLAVPFEERAEFYQWLNFDYATLHPSYGKLFATLWNEGLEDTLKLQILQHLGDKLSATWDILDERLSGRKFILGEKPTHVDYMAAIYSSWNKYFPDTRISLGENVRRFVSDVEALPEFKAGFKAEGAEFIAPT